MSDKWYVLDGKTPKAVDSMEEWARWCAGAERHVAKTDVRGGVHVSTVFLGLDHNRTGGAPLVFETMIFGGPHNGHQIRSSTWDEAERQHAEAVAMARGGMH